MKSRSTIIIKLDFSRKDGFNLVFISVAEASEKWGVSIWRSADAGRDRIPAPKNTGGRDAPSDAEKPADPAGEKGAGYLPVVGLNE
jgi:hypothetical protein